MKIREITVNDIADLLAIENASFDDGYDRDDFQSEFCLDGSFGLGLIIDNKLVGYILANTDNDFFEVKKPKKKYRDMNGIYVGSLAILPDYRGMDSLNELVSEFERRVMLMGFQYIRAHTEYTGTNAKVVERLANRFGYQVSGKVRFENWKKRQAYEIMKFFEK